jgi:hypothetical protein
VGYRSSLAVALIILAAGATAAEVSPVVALAPAPDAAPPAQGEVLEELDEILVRGRRLKLVIVEAEDEFYKLYNEVNKDPDYDTSCPTLNLDPDQRGSRIGTRVCLPGFMADAMANWAVSKIECTDYNSYDGNMDGRMSYEEAPDHARGRFPLLDRNGDRFLSPIEYADDVQAGTVACRPAPPPQLVLMERTRDWYDHMLKVTNSDPRLKKMASHLGDLYFELMQEQSRLNKVAALQEEGRARAAPPPNLGPRAR